MAFFDFLTGNSNEKRDIKNKQKSQQEQQQNQSNAAFGQVMPWAQGAQQQLSGLFNPGQLEAGRAGAGAGEANLQKSFEGNTNTLDTLHGGLMGMLAQPGYSAEESRGIKLGATSPVAGAYGGAQGALRNHVALTGNSAGFLPAQASLAHSKARDIGAAASGAAKDIADKRIAGTQYALGGLEGEAAGRRGGADVAGTQGQLGLARQEGERQNAAAGLLPVNALSPYYNGAQQGANQLQNQLYGNATKPGFLSGLIQSGVQSTGDALSGRYAATGGLR